MHSAADESDEPSIYAIRVSERAARDIDAAFVFIAETVSDEIGREWRQGLLSAMGTLATMPTRCPIAPDSAKMQPPIVRQLLYRRTPTAPAWRILFRVFEADADDTAYIGVAAILHGARRPLTRKEARNL